jgi:hypothetical protein
MNKKAEIILDKWKAELANRSRTRDQVEPNFEELFYKWHKAKLSYEQVIDLLPEAIKAHYPSDYVAKFTFKKMKKFINKNEDEYIKEWKANIAAAAKRVFYSFYDPEENSEEEKKYGSMSVMEYKKQRKYADSHPILDWESIDLTPISIDNEEIFDDIDIDLGDL